MSADTVQAITAAAACIHDDCERLAARVKAAVKAAHDADRAAIRLRVEVGELERENQWLRRRLDAADARHAAELDAAHAEIRRLCNALEQATRKRPPWLRTPRHL